MEQELELSAVIGFQGKAHHPNTASSCVAKRVRRPSLAVSQRNMTESLEIKRGEVSCSLTTISCRNYLTFEYVCIGKVNNGLILHPDNEHIIYPLGTTIVVRHIISRTQQFLRVSRERARTRLLLAVKKETS
jgi:hypothetical protein